MSDVGNPKVTTQFVDPKTGNVRGEWYKWLLNPTVQSFAVVGDVTFNNNLTVGNLFQAKSASTTNPIGVTSGGTGLVNGVSGGILGFTAANVLASSGLLGANQIMLGGGVGGVPVTPVGLGVSGQVLHGNAGGAPTWNAVSLTGDVTGTLPVANGGTNANAAGATAANNIGALAIASNLSDLNNTTTARTNLGLGTIATLSSPLPVANGGTAATAAGATAANNIGALAIASNLSDLNNAGTARTNLGLGSIATQAASAVAITGGTINGTTLGASTPSSVNTTVLSVLFSGTANTAGDAVFDAAIVGPSRPLTNSTGQLTIQSNDALGADLGGSIAFAARYHTATTPAAMFAGIGGRKENATSDNFAGYLHFLTRTAAGVSTEVGRFDSTGNLITKLGRADQSYSYQTPATGFSITIGANVQTLILEPSAGLATGTITMPAAPVDGQEIRITSTQSIVALTVSPNTGQSIKNAPTGFTVSVTGDQGYAFIYRAANTTWYRTQ